MKIFEILILLSSKNVQFLASFRFFQPAACNPPCKNGGVCKTPGKCECPEMFDGPQCEKMKSTCPAMPNSQTSKMDCDGNNCTVSCIEGHALSDGSMEMQMICENNKWMPANKQQSFEPNCERKIYVTFEIFENLF